MSDPQEPSAWEYDYQSPTGMGREVTLSPPWLADPEGVRNGRPLFRSPTLTDAEREAVKEVIDYLQPAGQKHQNHVAATLRGMLERLQCATK